MLTRITLLLFVLYALPAHLWPGLLAGAGLFGWLWRSRYRDSFLWFASLPGLYHFLGTSLEQAALIGSFADWGLTTLGLFLFGTAASSAVRQDRWAVLWLLPLLVFRLDGIALALLVLAHALYTLEREQSKAREIARPLTWNRNALVGVGVVLGLLSLVLVALPIQSPLGLAPRATSPTPQLESQAPEEPGSSSPPATAPRPRLLPSEPTPFARFAETALSLVLPLALGLFALLFTLVALAAITGKKTRQRPRGVHLVPLVMGAFFWAMLLLWLGVNQRSSGTGANPAPPPGAELVLPGEAAPQTRTSPLTDFAYGTALFTAILVTGLLILTVILVARLWRKLREDEPGETRLEKATSDTKQEVASSRIRRAYQSFLRQMEGQGYPRTSFESSREYAARLAKLQPSLKADLHELTELYEPVRYGGYGDESQAERAEALAGSLPSAFGNPQFAIRDPQRGET